MRKILGKIQTMRMEVASGKHEKKGSNDYSKYKYFTPEQVKGIALKMEAEHNVLLKYDFQRDSHGEPQGVMTVYDLQSEDYLIYLATTGQPEIKATNAAQQLGGAMTYSERYLLQFILGIADNTLDPDSTDNTKKRAAQPANEPTQTDDRQWLNLIGRDGKPAAAYYQIKDRIDAGEEITLASIMKKRKVSKVEQERLRTDFNIT